MNKSLGLAVVALAAALPFGAAEAHGNVAIRVETPEFGIRIGTPFPAYPPLIVAPAPVYVPPPVIYAPPPVIYAPPPRVIVPAPAYYGPPAFHPPGHDRTHGKVRHYKVKYHKGRDWDED